MSPRRKHGTMTSAEMAARAAKARMKKIPPEQRSAIARKAAKARWAKKPAAE